MPLSGHEENGSSGEERAAESILSLHTRTNLCSDQLECDINSGLSRAAVMKAKAHFGALFPTGYHQYLHNHKEAL